MFYKCGFDGNLATDTILETLKNAGIRMDDDYSIKFHRVKLKNLRPAEKQETPILDLDISTRAKTQLMSEGVFSVQGILDMKNELGSIPGIGAGLRSEIENAINLLMESEGSDQK